MDKSTARGLGIACAILSVLSLFVTVERCQNNADQVRAMQQVAGGFGQALGIENLQPAMPTVAKYALFLAALSGAAAAVFLSKAAKPVPVVDGRG